MHFFYWLTWCLIYLPMRLFFPTRIINRQKLNLKTRAVIACNHQSNMDIVVLGSFRHKMAYTLAKHTLFKGKIQSAVLRGLGGISVNREEVGTSTIRQVLKVLKADNQLIIFPEGTRKSSLEENAALKNGMALFALKTDSPVIPLYMVNKPKLWRMNKIIVGDPIYPKAPNASKENIAELTQSVLKAMNDLKKDYESEQRKKHKTK